MKFTPVAAAAVIVASAAAQSCGPLTDTASSAVTAIQQVGITATEVVSSLTGLSSADPSQFGTTLESAAKELLAALTTVVQTLGNLGDTTDCDVSSISQELTSIVPPLLSALTELTSKTPGISTFDLTSTVQGDLLAIVNLIETLVNEWNLPCTLLTLGEGLISDLEGLLSGLLGLFGIPKLPDFGNFECTSTGAGVPS